MILDYRGPEKLPELTFTDAETGESVTGVFYYDTQSYRLCRYLLDANGKPEMNKANTAFHDLCEHRRLVIHEAAAGVTSNG